MFGMSVLTRRKTCSRFVVLCSVHFDHSKTCGRLVELGRVRFHQRKTCRRRRLADIRSVFFHRKTCRRVVEHWRVRFDHCKARNRCYEECGLTIGRRIGGNVSFRKFVLISAKRVRG